MARVRPTSIGGLLVVFASAVVSIVSYGALAETIRIRWTVGTHYQYGPEHAPAIAVLVAFPVALLGLYVGFRWLERTLERTDEFEGLGILIEITAVAVLATVLAAQFLIVALNLWL
ncbi:hypothetical protein [Natronorubrum sp. FCH18a]|uniref:hypothetical protein n=1 Tax=Natronorubrum sp. FCH18a TaxID=3447018 RepID=UPI003F515561